MPKPKPTEQEISEFSNVPVDVAASFIGCSTPTLYRALQEERAPFGFAVKNPEGQWAYNISPGAILKYKHGELPFYKLKEVKELIMDGVEEILQIKTEAAKDAINGIFRV